MRPKIVLDSAITITPRLAQLPVDLVAVAGRDIGPEALCGAQGLLTRTVTRVDAALLEGSSVSFVGTASAGVDHVDLDYLSASGIGFASAAGCNAQAVGDYVLSAIGLCGRLEAVMEGATVGLVGYGNVGRQLAARLVDLGAAVRVFDPFVSDFGAGIDPLHIPRLTERFYRVDSHRSRQVGGTGLGLAIVKHIVQRHRGRLRIDSDLGKGAEFSVLLPRGDAV